ncbi:hypothetical protein JK358_37320 [Nocardia sp. 2]|uniref:Transposase n=1 Tax=Nocardia acididurans TaxID=2802282 RepID=A0ABS1MHD4_9NOCA|nr:hypothetical protein [Nocardia acididurans]MBL1080073.1 hypothetical protein [Nocardia acididurans]
MSAPERRYGRIDDRIRQTAIARVRHLAPAQMSRTAAAKAVARDIGVHFNTVLLWVQADDGRAPSRSVPRLEALVEHLKRELACAQSLNLDLTQALHNRAGGA